MYGELMNPAFIDTSLDARAATFENPTGARGAGGTAHGGRKGAPSRRIEPGERVVLADLDGPGVVRHLWVTVPPARPERMRALILEVRYDGRAEPSVAAPLLDFFGLPHGRPVAYHSMLTTAQEGRGFNSYLPMPFRERIEIAFTNHSERATTLYYQVDYTLQPELPAELGYLHVAFRRENPTVQQRDFVITEGLRRTGPLPRVRGRRTGDRSRQLVRRGRGEGVPRWRHRPAHDLRHRPRGLRRLSVGHGPARCALRGRATSCSAGRARRPRAWAPSPTS